MDSVSVDARKYVKQDYISLLTMRCVLLDQACRSQEQSDLVEQSFAVGLAVPGVTTFAAVVEEPAKTSHIAMLTFFPSVGGKVLFAFNVVLVVFV